MSHKKVSTPRKSTSKAMNWKEPFLQIAIRAIRKLHIEHGIWGVGQRINDREAYKRMNNGPGIEMANETSVCAAISQEYINSRFTNGNMINDAARYYQFDREVKLELPKGGNKFIDIFVNRFAIDKKDEIHYYLYPALIEVKRAHLFSTNPIDGNPFRNNDLERLKEIKKDINSLLKVRRMIKQHKSFTRNKECHFQKFRGKLKDAFLYMLCWGIWNVENNNINDRPAYLIKYIKQISGVTGVRYDLQWLPLEWKIGKRKTSIPEVTVYLWVALIEINPLKLGLKNDNNCERWLKINIENESIIPGVQGRNRLA